jgi:hypothetical protein
MSKSALITRGRNGGLHHTYIISIHIIHFLRTRGRNGIWLTGEFMTFECHTGEFRIIKKTKTGWYFPFVPLVIKSDYTFNVRFRFVMARTKHVALPIRRASPASGGRRHLGRYKPGIVALRDIRRYQKSTGLLLPYSLGCWNHARF